MVLHPGDDLRAETTIVLKLGQERCRAIAARLLQSAAGRLVVAVPPPLLSGSGISSGLSAGGAWVSISDPAVRGRRDQRAEEKAIRELRGLQTRGEVGDELLEAGGISIENRIILAAVERHGRSKNCDPLFVPGAGEADPGSVAHSARPNRIRPPDGSRVTVPEEQVPRDLDRTGVAVSQTGRDQPHPLNRC